MDKYKLSKCIIHIFVYLLLGYLIAICGIGGKAILIILGLVISALLFK